MNNEFFLKAIRLLVGNAWNRASLALIVGGVAAASGWSQYVIPALAQRFGVSVTIPDTPAYIGFLLIGLGILVLVLNRKVLEASSAPDPALNASLQRLAERVVHAQSVSDCERTASYVDEIVETLIALHNAFRADRTPYREAQRLDELSKGLGETLGPYFVGADREEVLREKLTQLNWVNFLTRYHDARIIRRNWRTRKKYNARKAGVLRNVDEAIGVHQALAAYLRAVGLRVRPF